MGQVWPYENTGITATFQVMIILQVDADYAMTALTPTTSQEESLTGYRSLLGRI